MFHGKTKVPSFHYLKGKDVTDKLKQLFGIVKDSELAKFLEISQETIATWHKQNLTPYEIILRVSLATGASIKALALDKGEFFKPSDSQIVMIPAKRISSGNIEDANAVILDRTVLPEQFAINNLMFCITDNGHYIIDCSHNDIINGKYIIEIEGKYSLNAMERLPNNMLAVKVMDVPVALKKSQINILGKVISSINQEY